MNDLIKDEYNALVEQKGITTVEEYQNYLFSTIDYCKIYAFDPEVDSYDDFSQECANRIKLFNLRNVIAFNRSINRLREVGIHLPDCRDSQDYWVGYEELRDLIESGGDQKDVLRLFPIVFGEYVVMPGDVNLCDPETKRFTTIGGHFPYVYLENTLPCSEYGPNNLWTVEKGKQWLKERQIALQEDRKGSDM